ncbi:MAG: carboxypeptidase-like regulatory domain-containing protein, partial [Planctomycetota bacterium]
TDAPFDVTDGSRRPVEGPTLILRKGAVIEGRVVDERGEPRPYVRVQCWQETGDPWETLVEGRRFMVGMADTVTDEKGEFRLTGLEPAQPHKVFTNLMMLPGHQSDPAELTGCLPGDSSIKFTVSGERMARGRVLDADSGEALVGFVVNGAVQWTADGSFAVPPGDRTDIDVSAPGYQARTVPLGDGGDLEVQLDPDPDAGALVFEVVDAAGRPVPAGTLVVIWNDAGFRMYLRTAEVSSGAARLKRMPPGAANITVTMEGHGREVRDVDIQPRSDTRVRLTLPRTGSVRLRIVDAKGNVLRHIPGVLLKGADGNGPSCRFVYTKPQGTAFVMTETWSDGREGGTPLTMSECDGTLHELPPGKYTLHVSMREAKSDVAFEVKVGETTPVTVKVGK